MEHTFAVLVLMCLLSFVLADEQVDILYALRQSLNASSSQLLDWNTYSIDPCTWSNVRCDSDSKVISLELTSMKFSGYVTPRIGSLNTLITLTLQETGISGKIPAEIGNLSSLTSLDLARNNFNGELPSSLGNLRNLEYLILSSNNLTGSVQNSLSNLPNLISLQLDSNHLSGQVPAQLYTLTQYNFTGNSLNCGGNSTHQCACNSGIARPSSKSKFGIIGGVVGVLLVVGMLLVVGLLCFVFMKKYRSHNREIFVDVAGEVDQRIAFGQLHRFAFRELQVATENFSETNVVGHGSFGKVYKGVLSDNTLVAVKRLSNYEIPGGDAAFHREVEMISVAFHRNLLRLIGYCTTNTERILVYPYMQNLSVAYHLRERKPEEPVLGWPTRKQVAFSTARALVYLHERCSPKIIHRDVKAANVFLDEDFEAVVGDFGLAKLVDVRRTNVTTQVRGTMGHIAPEYLSNGKSSVKTDVFGYGIMLLELVTGLRASDFSRFEDQQGVSMLDHVKRLEMERQLDSIVDQNLGENYDDREVEMIIRVALLCTKPSPEERPTMSEVFRMLEGEGLDERWQEWQNIQISRREEYERLQARLGWGEDSINNIESMEFSGGR